MDIDTLSTLVIVVLAALFLVAYLVRRWSRLAHERRLRDATRRGELERAHWL